MKALKSLLLIASVGVLFTFSNCGGGGSTPEPVSDQQFTKLAKTWKITSVTDGNSQNVTTSYSGFQLTLSGTKGQTSFNYSTTGRPSLSPWPSGSAPLGKWSFGADAATMIVRDPDVTTDKLDMNYIVTATTLKITFNFTNPKGYQGRTDQVTGNWEFNFGL
jgi:hypothetical protein